MVTRIEVFWDNLCFQTWVIIHLDAEGDQVGDAEYAHLKSDAKLYAKMDADEIEKETGKRPEIIVGTRT